MHKVGADLYSMCNGTVVYKTFDANGFGYYIIIKDAETGMGFLYGHLSEESPLNVGDSVSVGQYVGHEGTSGSSTGIHLHLEMQDISNHDWVFGADLSEYENPADFMGIPNMQGISAIYNGSPQPPTPEQKSKNSTKWLKFRSRKIILRL